MIERKAGSRTSSHVEPAPGGRALPQVSVLYQRLGVVAVLLVSAWLNLRHLGHRALTLYDEAFHAVTARNLLKHPLMPTLIDRPFLPYDFRDWTANHVWLHKPILPLWEIALSYTLFGVNTFALRLPGALLSTGAVLLTYLIGRELFDIRTAVVAATVQALNPAVVGLVQGYQFSDTFDVSLLFFVELGVYFIVRAMRTGSFTDVVVAGVAQGLAFLSKSYPAGIVTGIALAAWLAPALGLGRREETRVRGLHTLALVAVTLATIAPWVLYTIIRYPNEFYHEHSYVWLHLTTDVEGWGAPWDRLLFDYWIYLFSVFYTPVLVAAFVLLGRAVLKRDTKLWILYAWGVGVLIPHLVAVAKLPSATVFGLPPFFLLLGVLVSEGWRGNRPASTAWAMIAAICVFFRPALGNWNGAGYPTPNSFGTIMKGELWVVWYVAGALVAVAALEVGARIADARKSVFVDRLRSPLRRLILAWGMAGFILLGGRLAEASWTITDRDRNEPTFSEIAEYARRQLPDNAVLIHETDDIDSREDLLTMFLSDRTGYSTEPSGTDDVARQVVEAGGIPYIVTHRPLPLPELFSSGRDERSIYEWMGPGRS